MKRRAYLGAAAGFVCAFSGCARVRDREDLRIDSIDRDWPQYLSSERRIGEGGALDHRPSKVWSRPMNGIPVAGDRQPVLSDGMVVSPTRTEVFAFDISSGEGTWTTAHPDDRAYNSTGVISDGQIFVPFGDGVDVIDLESGDRVGQLELDARASGAAPAVADGRIILSSSTDQSIVGLLESGMERFHIDLSDHAGGFSLSGDDIYINSTDYISSFVISSGTNSWATESAGLSEAQNSPILIENDLFIPRGDGRILAFDADSGRQLWENHLSRYSLTSPTVSAGAVVVSDMAGTIYLVDRSTGRTSDSLAPDGGRKEGLSHLAIDHTPIKAGNEVLYVSPQGRLLALDTADGSFSERWKLEDAHSYTGPPVVLDGILFISSGLQLHAYSSRT